MCVGWGAASARLTIGPAGVSDGLDCLHHHTVVRSNHQDDDVRGAGSAGSHGGEGSMSGCVQEGDGLTCRQLDWKEQVTRQLLSGVL